MGRKLIFGQDKDYSSPLSKTVVDKVTSGFKDIYEDSSRSEKKSFLGFELNGGDGMTSGGKKSWDEFSDWCDERNLNADYSTNTELERMRNKLWNRNKNKNKNT